MRILTSLKTQVKRESKKYGEKITINGTTIKSYKTSAILKN